MRKVFYLVGIALTLGLVSCEKKDEINMLKTTSQNEVLVFDGYCIQDGYLKFDTQESYDKKLDELYSATPDQLKQWRAQLPFKTLEEWYQEENIPEYVYIDAVSDIPVSHRNINKLSEREASLFNEQGIVMIGNKILKIEGKYIYEINNGDFSLVSDIENGKEISPDFVTKERHTILLDEDDDDKLKAKKIKDRTLVFYISANERVFIAFEGVIENKKITFEMRGKYQSKNFLGWGVDPTTYNFSWGSISVEGTCGSNRINFVGERVFNTNYVLFKLNKERKWDYALTATFYYKATNRKAYMGDWEKQGQETNTEGSYVMQCRK